MNQKNGLDALKPWLKPALTIFLGLVLLLHLDFVTSILVALRTVHGHSFVVAADSPTGILYDTVEQGVGACEVSHARHLITHGVCLEAVFRIINGSAYLHIAESMIYE